MKLIRDTIEYLYYKYYFFQVRMGNGDIAKYSPLVIIAGVVNLYLLFIFMVFNLFFDVGLPQVSKVTFIILFFLFLLFLYMLLVHGDKQNEIIHNDKFNKRSNLLAILFPLIGFIIFNVGWILKMLQNQGRI